MSMPVINRFGNKQRLLVIIHLHWWELNHPGILEISVLALSGKCHGQLSVSFIQGIAGSSYTGDSAKTDSDSIALKTYTTVEVQSVGRG